MTPKSSEMTNKLEIELLKKDVIGMSALLKKFDTTIDRMQEIASNLSKMISLQEQRIAAQELVTKEMQGMMEMRRLEHNAEVKNLNDRIDTVNRDLTKKIEETEQNILDEIKTLRTELKGENRGLGKRLGEIELWKYGAAIVIAFLLFLASRGVLDLGAIIHK